MWSYVKGGWRIVISLEPKDIEKDSRLVIAERIGEDIKKLLELAEPTVQMENKTGIALYVHKQKVRPGIFRYVLMTEEQAIVFAEKSDAQVMLDIYPLNANALVEFNVVVKK
jgi:hypothetical protein